MLFLILTRDWDPQWPSGPVGLRDIDRWLYLGEDSTWRLRAEKSLLADIPRFSITRRLDEVSRQLRAPYIEWIGSLSQGNDSAEWWASEIAAKNPYTNLFTRICFLKVGQESIDFLATEKMLIVCSSPAVLHHLFCVAESGGCAVKQLNPPLVKRLCQNLKTRGRRCARAVFMHLAGNFFFCFFLTKCMRGNLRRRLGKLGDYVVYRWQWLHSRRMAVEPFSGDRTVLLFTWVDDRNFTEDEVFVDPHLGPLAERLQTLGYAVRYVVFILPGTDFFVAAERLRETSRSTYFPEYFLDRAAVGRCFRRARSFAPVVPADSEVGELPVDGLVREHIEDYRITLAHTLFYEEIVAGFSESGVCPDSIIHTCEGHSWEQALASAVHRHMPATEVIGFENGTFTSMFHSMYPAIEEFHRRPLPDRIMTYGTLSRDILLREGWPTGRVREGCALRHDYICRESPRTQPLCRIGEAEPVRILLASGIGPGETLELIDKAGRAFAGRSSFVLTVKCHPLVASDWVQSELGARLDYDNLSFSSAPVSDLLSTAHVLLYTYSTVCYEALSHGVLPVFVSFENFLNLNKMDAFPDLYWQAADSDELRQVVECLVDMSEEEYDEWLAGASAAVRAAFTPIDEEKILNFVS